MQNRAPLAYTRKDVAWTTGATNSHLTYWTKKGIVRASVEDTKGAGHHRQHAFRDVVDAQIALCLTRVGVPTVQIAWILEMLRYAIFGEPRTIHDIAVNTTIRDARGKLREQLQENSRIDEESFQPFIEGWRLFLDPEARSRVTFLGVVYRPNERAPEEGSTLSGFPMGQWTANVDIDNEVTDLGQDAVRVIVNCGLIVKQLEQATGDSYGSVVRADERRRRKGAVKHPPTNPARFSSV